MTRTVRGVGEESGGRWIGDVGGELQKRKMIKIAEEKRKTGASLQQRDERRMQ